MKKGQEVNRWRKQIADNKNGSKNVIPPATVTMEQKQEKKDLYMNWRPTF